MSELTHRQRLLRVLDGRPCDRVPIWLLFSYHPVGYYADVRNNPCYSEIFELSKQYAVMLNRRSLRVAMHEPSVVRTHEERVEGNCRVRREWIEHAGRRLFSERRTEAGQTTLKQLLDNEDDLRIYCSMPINTDEGAIAAELDAQLADYQREVAEFSRDAGAMMLDLGEPIGALYGVSNLAEYALWSVTADDVVIDFLQRMQQRMRIIYRWCIQRKLADVYFLVGSELASPPLVSPDTFDRWVVPYARELIEMVRQGGGRVIQHYHGQIRGLLRRFVAMGAHGLHTIEAPPTGNCTLTEAYQDVGDAMCLIGNIQYDCFRSMSPDEMREAVAGVIAEAAGRRLILSPTAGPYEHTISRRMIDNYLEFLRAGWELGRL
jgi:uroporphyrinogen-III decarboxylase